MSLLKLRFAIYGTLALIIGTSTLAFAAILRLLGVFNLGLLLFLVVVFNIVQWLIAPRLIESMYKAREVSQHDHPKLYNMVRGLSRRIGVKMPRVMVADIPCPNAFAYGSPLGGNRVAVTTGLLRTLEEEEVEAVIGHELGHLKHRDVQVMMFVSIIPAILYWIYISTMFSMWGGRGSSALALVGVVCLALYWVLTLFILHLSRLREYFADKRSAMSIPGGSRKLSEALAKIVTSTAKSSFRRDVNAFNEFKSLFIADPSTAGHDEILLRRAHYSVDQQLVERILRKPITLSDKIAELFSTHPNIVKRLRALRAKG
jgi:heat shock protein HtpX